MKAILFFCMFLLCSCARGHEVFYPVTSPRVVKVYVDVTFGIDEVDQIGDALGRWNETLNGALILRLENRSIMMEQSLLTEIVGRGDYIIFSITSSQSVVADTVTYKDGKELRARTLAYCDQVGGHYVYLLMDRLSLENIRWVMMHEIGHLLGAEHQEDGLMYRYYRGNNYRCVDRHTLEQVSRAQKINLSQLRGCSSDVSSLDEGK
jgi:hypothetical protein